MSRQKAKQIRELAKVPTDDRDYGRGEMLRFETSLHQEAFYFMLRAMNPPKDRNYRKPWQDEIIETLTRRLSEACNHRRGAFFRALADALEGENPNWSKRERFIYALCQSAADQGKSLPFAAELLRAWQTVCGVLPERRADLLRLWRQFYGRQPMPQARAKIERKLRTVLGVQNAAAANVPIVQIQREAKNLGFDLPKRSRRPRLPAEMALPPNV